MNISRELLNTLQELRKGQEEFEVRRLELAKKYATYSKNGKPKLKDGKYIFTWDNEAKFLKWHQALIKEEREYNINPVKLPEDFKISTADLLLLKDIIIEL